MRSSLLLSILVAAVLGACGQSLTPDKTGTGGSGTGGGGATGGSGPGAGGSGGSVAPICNTLTAEYQSALTAAETCQVGASGQCDQIVSGALSGCSCPTYVTDSSALATIQNAWQVAGCVSIGGTCLCPIALNTTCVSADGGSAGFCSYVPGTGGSSGAGGSGATGGTSGAGGSAVDGGLSACGTFVSEYAAVLIGAKSCTAGATGQCGTAVPSSLSPCSAGCNTTFVTDSSVLDSIRKEWDAAGCGNVPTLCPLIACRPATSGTCVASDAGGSVCSTSYQPVPVTAN